MNLNISIPASWRWCPVKHVATYLSRGTAPNYVEDGPVRIIGQASNQAAGIDWNRTRFHQFDGTAQQLRGFLYPGDILINSTGTVTLGRVGYFADRLGDQPCVADGHITVLRFDENLVDSRFAYYWLSSQPFQELINAALAVGATNQIELNRESLGSALLPVPELGEQRRIVRFLDAETSKIDRLAAGRGKQISILAERERTSRDGLIDRLFDQFGALPLRRFMTTLEQGASPQCDNRPRDGENWGVLKLGAVKRGQFYPSENKGLPSDLAPVRKFEVRDNDLLVTRANTPELVGDVAVAENPPPRLLLPDLIYRIGLEASIIPQYVAHVALGSRVRLLIEAAARGSSQSMVKLRGEDIREWLIPASPLAQQRATVNQLDRERRMLRDLRAAISRQLALLSERRQALITAAVTGQIDVTTARGIT